MKARRGWKRFRIKRVRRIWTNWGRKAVNLSAVARSVAFESEPKSFRRRVLFPTRDPWEEEMRHVSAAAVARVMKLFRTSLLIHEETAGPSDLKTRQWLGKGRFAFGRTFQRG